MKPLYNLNDTHLGAIRSGGTTPTTALKLREDTLARFGDLLGWCDGGDLIINGDLFDAFNVPYTDMWRAMVLLGDFAVRNPGSKVYASRGNHDVAKNTTIMSTFDLFCKVMAALHESSFVAITAPTALPEHDAYVIPHMPNQDLFNEALKAVPKCKRLFLHANFDNKFAVEADHSLNVSVSQAEALPVDQIIFGHEHQYRSEMGGKVVIVGNQIPTSVADCLGNKAKFLLRITDKLEHIPVWDRDSAAGMDQPDWRALTGYAGDYRFIRVTGEASSAEAALVVSAISKLRSKHEAFVITNAVTIDGVKADEDIKMSLESLKAFDVLAELLALLDADEASTISKLIEKHNVQTTQAE